MQQCYWSLEIIDCSLYSSRATADRPSCRGTRDPECRCSSGSRACSGEPDHRRLKMSRPKQRHHCRDRRCSTSSALASRESTRSRASARKACQAEISRLRRNAWSLESSTCARQEKRAKRATETAKPDPPAWRVRCCSAQKRREQWPLKRSAQLRKPVLPAKRRSPYAKQEHMLTEWKPAQPAQVR